MTTMKTIPPSEYVKLVNSLNGKANPGCNGLLVTYTISGANLDQRTHLNIPRDAWAASASSMLKLRRRGIFCFPILAPLDEPRPFRPYRRSAATRTSAELA